MNSNNKIIVLTGPCGVGKTTIAKIISQKIEVELINGDELRQSLFPEATYITEFPDKLAIVKETILELSQKHLAKHATVLIDYVILGKAYITRFQDLFKEDLIFKVILPRKKVIYERDEQRECWTSGRAIIDELYDKFLALEELIGAENFIDNEGETAEETAARILRSFGP